MVRQGFLRSGQAFAFCLAWAPSLCHAASEKIIATFGGYAKGGEPTSRLLRLGGKFYGTTNGGGTQDNGTIFFVQASGHHAVLYRFSGGTDGSRPSGSLIEFGGTLYGTTAQGGGSGCGGTGCGTLYSITPQGVYAQLYAFQGGTDGAYPDGLVEQGGLLYGAATSGGAGFGVIFSATPQGGVTPIYTFHRDPDGWEPRALISDGTRLYGTTTYGAGTGCQSNGCGTVFSIDPQGDETTIATFGSGTQGGEPYGRLLKIGNELYGTTYLGGKKDVNRSYGAVFRVSLAGAYTLLHAFNRTDGGFPYAGLTRSKGTLYGATSSFGKSGAGTIFAISPQGKLSTLYDFQNGADGDGPVADLLADGGTLYGTTIFGGGKGERSCGPAYCGTVFAFTP